MRIASAAVTDGGDTSEATRWPIALWTLVWILAALVGLAALANATPWIAAPPGDSHEGRNAAVWGLAARSLREHPIESRLGGRRPDGKPYADHPPVIVFATALTTLAGEGGIAFRVPPIIASLASLALMLVILRRMGYSPLAAGVGVVLMGTSAMFLTYGFMLDTPMIGLPLALAGLLVARRVQEDDAPRTWAIATVGLLAGLTSWQGALAVVLVALAICVPSPTRDRRLRPAAVLAGSTVAGGALSVAWAWWAFGSLAALKDSFVLRNGDPSGWFDFQQHAVGDLFGPILVAVAVGGTVVAVVRRRHVAITGVVLAVSVAWVIGFRQGASIHNYWTYFAVLSVGLGAAALTSGLEVAVDRHVADLGTVVRVAVVIGVGAMAITSVLGASDAERVVMSGADGGRVASGLPRAATEETETVVALEQQFPGNALWAAIATHGRVGTARSGELEALARAHPDLLVLIRQPQGTTASAVVERRAVAHRGPFYVVPIDVCVKANNEAFRTGGSLAC